MKSGKMGTTLFIALLTVFLSGCSDPLESELSTILKENLDELEESHDRSSGHIEIRNIRVWSKKPSGEVLQIFIGPGVTDEERRKRRRPEDAVLVSFEAEVEYLETCYMWKDDMFNCDTDYDSVISRYSTKMWTPQGDRTIWPSPSNISKTPEGTIMFGKGTIWMVEEETGWRPLSSLYSLERSHMINK
jgi:hypothetical protein